MSTRFEKLPGQLGRLKESVAYAVNPNHRHDEAHEQEQDRIREEIRQGHRFRSFADVKEGNDIKWFINGHDYFWAVSEILEQAKEIICIADWWLTPELHLRRPPAKHEDYRLDRLLLRKAQQGVRIFVMVYKEVTQTMSMSSHHTKHHLEDMHGNISVMRHPDHAGGEVTLLWSHHEKIVIVDNAVACIGGLDLCFGRWDRQTYPLADVHPTDMSRSLFAGQDYNNARVADFQNVDHWVSNQQSRLEIGRMPWHDVHTMLVGPAVMDVAQHFVERWNMIRHLKYRHNERFPMLAFPHVVREDEEPKPAIVRHPHWETFKELGEMFKRHAHDPQEPGGTPFGGLGQKGNMRVQVLRSSADWSHGILTESSINNAYVQMISEASHHILIENQFFITSTVPGPRNFVHNLIGKALVERVLSAARSNQPFRVDIFIPAVPGFAGDLDGNSGTLAILGATYYSLSRGGDSIFEVIEREGFDPNEYIKVYNLRSYDRINYDPDRLRRMSENSGVSWDQAQSALARLWLGPLSSEQEINKNSKVTFALGIEGGESLTLLDDKNKSKDKTKPPTITLDLPSSYAEALDIVRRFEQADDVQEHIIDSVSHHALRGNDKTLVDEPWSGTEDSERMAFVTEELYIHSKLLIVDDRRVLIGSANLNERSQLGDRDSEIAIVIEDTDMIQSKMASKPFMATRFAATLRRQLFKDHLGLLDVKKHAGPVDEVKPSMRPVGIPLEDDTMSEEDAIVQDPLSPEFVSFIREVATKNTEIFEDVFHVTPTDRVKTWKEYREWVPQAPIKSGHVASLTRSVSELKASLRLVLRAMVLTSFVVTQQRLSEVRGHIVNMPLHFLEKEKLLALDASVNPATLNIYL
ncbi:hypothetical protein OIO90_000973 [Microbotryomycetes sp. JL221]|nr:hypothetical protein OIO90_000973 [Microbotryomycetes sp. JL221]